MPFGLGTGFGIGVELPLSELELELNCKNGIDPSSVIRPKLGSNPDLGQRRHSVVKSGAGGGGPGGAGPSHFSHIT